MTLRFVSPEEAREIPYPFVFVNEDQTVRELHESERKYLEEEFEPFDGGRPYVKQNFESRDGWGSLAGFCHRSFIPSHLAIAPPPVDDPNPPMSKDERIEWLKEHSPNFDVIDAPGRIILVRRAGPPTDTPSTVAGKPQSLLSRILSLFWSPP